MTPKVTEEHVTERKEQIVKAACRCFARNGFHRTTMQEICDAAELSPGAVYSYFESKEEIIETMAAYSLERNAALLEDLRQQGDIRRAVTRLAERSLEILEDPECGPWLPTKVALWGEAFRSPEVKGLLDRSYVNALERLAGIIRQGQERGEILATLDPDAVARLLVSFLEGLFLQKAMHPEMDARAYWQAVDAVLDGTIWHGDW